MAAPLPRRDEPLAALLSARSPSENTPLLLAVARAQAARRTPADLRAQWATDAFVRPAALDLRTAHALDALALEAASDFDAPLLSPLCPLGTCAAVSPSAQDRVVSTSRGTEVVSDPTNVLALLAADRLAGGEPEVRLCTVGQVVRAQRSPDRPGFSQHFRMLASVIAGRARADHAFEVEAFDRQARLFLRCFELAGRLGCSFAGVRATLHATPARRGVAERLRGALGALPLSDGEPPSPYYDGVRLLVWATPPGGREVPIGDVGLFDWVARLTSNRRYRMVAAGLGVQLFAALFRGA